MKIMRRFYSLLGLCKKAGKLCGGEVAAESAIRKKGIALLILAEDASENTKKKFRNSAAYYKIPLIEVGDKANLGRAIGDEYRAIIAVMEEGFAKKLSQLAEQETSEHETSHDE